MLIIIIIIIISSRFNLFTEKERQSNYIFRSAQIRKQCKEKFYL